MSDTPTATIEAEFPRRFVAPDADFGAWPNAETYYRELAERPVESAEELERWLLDLSEADAVFNEERTRRYTAMTCATNDEQRKRSYLDFVENVKPHREPWHHRLRQRFAELAQRFPLPPARYEVLERSTRNAIEIYRDENVPLLTEDEKLQQRYQEIIAAMTCEFGGRELTLQQLARYLEEPDRAVRESAWRLAADRFLQDGPELDALYGRMVALRARIAENAGCRDYVDYAFHVYERFDYTPDDCRAFHDAIEAVVVPAARELTRRRCEKLKLGRLRPWDLAVDAEGRAPLHPFDAEEQLVARCSAIFHKVHPELGEIFDTMRARGLLDLSSRKGKAPGGYQESYEEQRVPFIFMNAVGTEGDVRTLLHEGGHAFHAWAARNEPLRSYRHAPIEFAEVASMGMECLALPHTELFFGDQTPRAHRRFFEEIVLFFPWMARVDALQHHVYRHVGDGVESWKDHWQSLTQRFSPEIDWSGLEAYDRRSWHRKLHFFEVPLYYVEYGIAQLGALQVWLNSRKDYEQAVAQYRNGLTLGGARPLPELFAAAGCKFDFSEKTLKPLIDALMAEIDRL